MRCELCDVDVIDVQAKIHFRALAAEQTGSSFRYWQAFVRNVERST
jgi:hypothetical protein